ncbi:hypothetical protein MP638_002611 [Amoeboaphelidium occidentale]|nr:hypothetical protein MP638_002611 [Amoeboaphelidium occidentale]
MSNYEYLILLSLAVQSYILIIGAIFVSILKVAYHRIMAVSTRTRSNPPDTAQTIPKKIAKDRRTPKAKKIPAVPLVRLNSLPVTSRTESTIKSSDLGAICSPSPSSSSLSFRYSNISLSLLSDSVLDSKTSLFVAGESFAYKHYEAFVNTHEIVSTWTDSKTGREHKSSYTPFSFDNEYRRRIFTK